MTPLDVRGLIYILKRDDDSKMSYIHCTTAFHFVLAKTQQRIRTNSLLLELLELLSIPFIYLTDSELKRAFFKVVKLRSEKVV